jgi:hypothetical protein
MDNSLLMSVFLVSTNARKKRGRKEAMQRGHPSELARKGRLQRKALRAYYSRKNTKKRRSSIGAYCLGSVFVPFFLDAPWFWAPPSALLHACGGDEEPGGRRKKNDESDVHLPQLSIRKIIFCFILFFILFFLVNFIVFGRFVTRGVRKRN